MNGTVEEISEIKAFKSGETKGRSWTLWGQNLVISGSKYSVASFDKAELEDNIIYNLGDEIDFEVEKDSKYPNTILLNTMALVKKGEVISKTTDFSKPSEEEYREYQKKLMLECLKDAEGMEPKLLPDSALEVAIAFFDKRCSPYYYAKKEGV